MITGTVTSRREATIHLPVRDADGREHEVEAILDTGFTGSLTLPMSIITMLRLPWRTRGLVILANGTEDLCDMYAATIVWDGIPRNILVEAAETEPLLGMALLDGHSVRLDVVAGGQVVIEALP